MYEYTHDIIYEPGYQVLMNPITVQRIGLNCDIVLKLTTHTLYYNS